MASFAKKLVSGLSSFSLPLSLLQQQKKKSKGAKKKEIAGLSSADSPFDPEASIVRKFPSLG